MSLVAASDPQVSDATLRGLVGYALRRANIAMQADLKQTLEPFGLRMITFSALAVIHDNPGLTQSALAGALSIERANLVQLVDELETLGLLNRQKNPQDRRSNALGLTKDGTSVFGRAIKAVTVHEARMTRDFDDDGRRALCTQLELIERR